MFDTAFPIVLFLVTLVLGMPIGFSLIVAGAAGIWINAGWMPLLGILRAEPYRHASSFLLTTIPLFILMAELLARGTVVQAMFRCAYAFVGHLRGGLALAAVGANAGFAALSGSSTAAAAAMARISIPEMRRFGYDDRLSLGTVAIAGTLAIMIPPSLGLIIYGILTESSIGRLFVAGIVPGLLSATGFVISIMIWVRRDPTIAPQVVRTAWPERLRSLTAIGPAMLLVVFVAGSIYSGAATPTEAAAIGALAALVISVAFGGLRGEGMLAAFRASIRSTALIFTIIIGAMIFGKYLAITRLPQDLLETIVALNIPGWAIIAILIVIYLILGCFLDQLAVMLLTLPLTFPLVVGLGYDPIWWGIVLTKTSEIGLVTPPLGLNSFVVSASADAPLEKTFSGVWRLLVGDMIVLLLLLLFPALSLGLPGWWYGP
ncbi:MAG: C4-dicarboxylate ABC transporter permease [Tistrella sp.]|uniref:TRAP transporter large permease protein n=1 Tax=Tistrella mobilis TaxID=171437 RepID=A0A3B9IHQ4_9PROT|nr:TRAP transporter large permease [Tistrella sp.]MAD38524.1 C4-dicarboxylate ABC transporter permease [Tistrella sp.]MBA79115.1 C4-dicarboxylate ABC transporter permease [Tistrella sp.]HAE46827.1 C4-dicarboxylate ABC transporter permease [Tistrella mobilis]